jgi:hypothetical protein
MEKEIRNSDFWAPSPDTESESLELEFRNRPRNFDILHMRLWEPLAEGKSLNSLSLGFLIYKTQFNSILLLLLLFFFLVKWDCLLQGLWKD